MAKQYICQLKDGVMLVRDMKYLAFENTGYPYPSTEKSNIVMLQELIYNETGILKSKDSLYNYVDMVAQFSKHFTHDNSEFLVTDFCYFLAYNDFSISDYLSDKRHVALYRYKDYVIVYSLKAIRLMILKNTHYMFPEVKEHMLCNMIIRDLKKHYGSTSTIDENILWLLFNLFLDEGDVDSICNIPMTTTALSSALINFINSYRIHSLLHDYIFYICNILKREYSVYVSDKNFLSLYEAVEYDYLHFRSNSHREMIFEFLIFHFNVRLNRHIGKSYINSSCKDIISDLVNNKLPDEIADIVYDNDIERLAFSKLCTFTNSNGRLIFKLNEASFDLGKFFSHESFRDFKAKLYNIILIRENKLGMISRVMSPSVFTNTIEWYLDDFVTPDSSYLLPMLFTMGRGVDTFKINEYLIDNDINVLIDEIFTKKQDIRHVVFDGNEPVEKSLLRSFADYNADDFIDKSFNYNTANIDFSYKGKNNIIRCFGTIPNGIVSCLGEFNLFARMFYACRQLFTTKFIMNKTEDMIECSYIFALYSDSEFIPLDISKEVFDKYVRGACIIDFMLQIILRHIGGISDYEIMPISVNNIKVSFNPEEQKVSLEYLIK